MDEGKKPHSNSGLMRRSTTDDVVKELTQRQNNLEESIERLIRFQRQALVLKNARTADELFDVMESLLIEVVDFMFASLLFRDDAGGFTPIRDLRPESLVLDFQLMNWVMDNQEVAVLPISIEVEGTRLSSLLFLPFGKSHIMLLWLEQEPEEFTREQEAHLSVLCREMAGALETYHHHAQLDKTRAAMSDIIESVPLGIIALDHVGNVLMINSTAEIALNVRRQKAVGNAYHLALPSAMAELLSKMIQEKSSEEEELVMTSLNDEDQYLGVTVSPMQTAEDSGYVVVCRDLQLSREVQKLRTLDAMKNDFLSLVSHELRTPLTSIMAYSETLLMDDNDNVPKEWREYLDIIHSEGKRLCRLIDDVLDLTKMEAGKLSYDFEMYDPNEVIGTVVMTLMPLLEGKGHTLDLDLAEDIGDCRISIERFTQVANNVISNAIKYTNEGGHIRVKTYRAGSFPGNKIPTFIFEVEDNGIGIAKENMSKVFSKFEMVGAIQNHTSGTGLGLAICKQIVEEGHSGKIWVESEPGVGTRVFVQIPVH